MAQVAIKYAEHTLTPGALSAFRFGIAALCFAPNAVSGFRHKELRNAATELGLYLFGEALCFSCQAAMLLLLLNSSHPAPQLRSAELR